MSGKAIQTLGYAKDIKLENILSTEGQAFVLDDNGFRMRKWNSSRTDYEAEQIWLNNNMINFTRNGWQTSEMAIGKLVDPELGELWGVCAPALVGKMLAGTSLVIESQKKDNGVAVFRVDADGAKLHNAIFDIYNGTNTQITLNPYSGFAIGAYGLVNPDYTIDTSKAKFYVDTNGNLFMKGNIEAESGTFRGVVRASDYQDLSGRSMLVNGSLSSGYQFSSDYLSLYGLTVRNKSTNATTFAVSDNGLVTINGTVIMGSGSSINWNYVDSDPNIARLANGTYTGGTFINGSTIYSPIVEGGDIRCSLINGNTIGKIGFYHNYATNPSASIQMINSGAGTGSGNTRSLDISTSVAGDMDLQMKSYADVLLKSFYGAVRVDCYGNGRFYSETGSLYIQAAGSSGQVVLAAGNRVRIAAPSGTQYDFRNDGIYFNNVRVVAV